MSMQAVFISDLHLHPNATAIEERFNTFIRWAVKHTQAVYILGDFLDVWPGDDALDPWSQSIIARLAWLASQGIQVYFMPGNRDFLIGKRFLQQAKITLLPDPYILTLGKETVLLSHGDRFCSRDKSHQLLRILTRNTLFTKLFLRFPYHWRSHIVSTVRMHSEDNRAKAKKKDMGIVNETLWRDMRRSKVSQVIHGHIHQPGQIIHKTEKEDYRQYVLSDWDDTPEVLCYYRSKSFEFIQIL